MRRYHAYPENGSGPLKSVTEESCQTRSTTATIRKRTVLWAIVVFAFTFIGVGTATNAFALITQLTVRPASLSFQALPGQTISASLSVFGGDPDYTIIAQKGTVTPDILAQPGSITYSLTLPVDVSGRVDDMIRVRDSLNTTVVVPVTITVMSEPLSVSPSRIDIQAYPGERVAKTISVAGGAVPYIFDTSFGTVTPSPMAAPGDATYSFTVPAGATGVLKDTITVVDSTSTTKRVPVTITVVQAPLSVTPTSINLQGTPGQTLRASLAVTGGTLPYQAGTTLGSVSPTSLQQPGTVTFSYTISSSATVGNRIRATVRIVDTAQNVVQVPVTISVVAPLSVTPDKLTLQGRPGETVSASLAVAGGTAPYRFDSGSGQVNPNPLNAPGSATYSYTIAPNASGTLQDSITVTDAGSQARNVKVTIAVITPALVVTPSAFNLAALPGDMVTAKLAVSGGMAPYRLSATLGSVAPDNLAQPGASTFSYTIPQSAQPGKDINATITVTDAAGQQVNVPVTISVLHPLSVDPKSLKLPGTPGVRSQGKIRILDGQPPFTLSVKSGSVSPATLPQIGEATYSFDVPANAAKGATYQDTVTVTDAAGRSATIPVTVAVDPLSSLQGLTPPERSVAEAIEKIFPTLLNRPLTPEQQDMRDRFAELLAAAQTSPQEVPAALSAIAPEEASAVGTLATEVNNRQFANISERMKALRSGVQGISISGLTMNMDGQSVPLGALAQASLFAPKGGAASADDGALGSRLGVFVSGSFDFGDKDGTDNESGFDFDVSSFTAGADYRFTKKLVLGGAFGYGYTDLDIDNSGGSLDDDAWTLSLYGLYNFDEHLWVNGIFSYTWNHYDSNRRIAYDLSDAEAVDRNADADYDGSQYAISLSAGYDIFRKGFTLGAFGTFAYSRTDVDSYQESGATGLDLAVDDQSIDSLTTTLGAKVSYALSTSFGVLVPQLSVDWEHEFEDGDRTLDVRFVHDPNGYLFGIPTDSPDRDYFHVSPGISAVFAYGFSAYVNYEVTLGKTDLNEQNVTFGVRYEF